METSTISIAGLTPLDQLELEPQFAPGSVRFEEEALTGAKHGEPLTLILIAGITSASLGVLGSYLLKDRTSDRIRKTVRVTDAKGNTREEMLDIDLRTSKSPKKDVIRELAKACHIDLDAFKETNG